MTQSDGVVRALAGQRRNYAQPVAHGLPASVSEDPINEGKARIGALAVRVPTKVSDARRRVYEIFGLCPWLEAADIAPATRLATLEHRFKRLAKALERLPALTERGDARRADSTLSTLSKSMSGLEEALAIPITARVRFGLDVARGRDLDLAAAMAERGRDG